MINERGFHIQLIHNEWVFWGYGPQKGTLHHVYPAAHHIKLKDHEFNLPFELPKSNNADPAYATQEYYRKVGWGWRWRSNNLMVDSGWYFAESKEEALKDMREKINNAFVPNGNHPEDIREDILKDVREYDRVWGIL